MESALYSIWAINLRNLARNKLHICREWHIQPSEIDKLPYYQYEEYLELIQEHNKEEEKRRKQDEKNHKIPNMTSMMNSMKNSMPKLNIPKF